MRRCTPGLMGILLALWAGPAAAQLVEFGPPYTATAGFLAPTGVAVDESHDLLFVADTGNQRLKYAPISGLTGAPSWSDVGYVPDLGTAAALDGPQGVAVDAAGNVYVVDTFAGEVQLYRYDAAAGYAYDPSFAASSPHSAAGVPITFPRDVSVGPDGKVYLLDSGNARVLVADGPGASAWSVWHADASWLNPYGLDVGADGKVWVADTGNSRIVRIAADGTSTEIGGYGQAAGQFRGPRDVAVTPDGRVVVADTLNHRVTVLDVDGSFAGHLAVAPLVASPQKVSIDARGRVFVVDSEMSRVVAFLGASVPRGYDLYVRDGPDDVGAEPSVGVLASPDIVFRRSPDVDLSAVTSLDGVASEQPIIGQDVYVYVAVHNAGAAAAHDTSINLYWAYHDGPLAYPADWRDAGIAILDGSGRRVSGHALLVSEISPDGVRVLGPFVWTPSPSSSSFDVLVRVVNPYDPIVRGGTGREAAVRASNDVAMRSTVLAQELPDGDFVADLSGDLYVEILYSKASYANYFVLTDPQPATPSTCAGFSVPNCFFGTAQCRSKCRQDSSDVSCACLANELISVGHVERGQRIAAQLHTDKGRDGNIDDVYSSKPALNGDGFDHLHTFNIYPGAWVLEWEDRSGGGDRDFNDMVILVRIISPDAPQAAPPLAGTPLWYVTNVQLEDRTTAPSPKLRVTTLLQNPSDAPQRIAVCPRVPLDGTYSAYAQSFSYSANPRPPPGTPVHVYPGVSLPAGAALSREPRPWDAPAYVYEAPRIGDQVMVPARTAAGPGEATVHYEVDLADLDRELAHDYGHIHLADKTRDELRQVIVQKGITSSVFTDIAPERLRCPSGALSVFSGDGGGVATPSVTTTYPFTYNIASPARITVPTVTPRMEASGATVVARLEFFWTDNLPVHLRGHIVSEPAQRVAFVAWPSTRREIPVTVNFADDVPETFRGKLETILRDANSGAVLLTATNIFTKDHTAPVFSAVHTERSSDRVDVTATGDGGPAGLARAALLPSVDGAAQPTVYLRRVAGDFSGPTELDATVSPVADAQRVAIDLQAADGAGNELAQRLPVASTGGDLRLECSAPGGSWVDLDGTRSTAASDVPVAYAWGGPFGSASGASPRVFFPLGASPFSLVVSDGRGYTGREGSVATVVDTTPPTLKVAAAPACLWPPNHKLVPLRLGRELGVTARDACDVAPRVRVVRVESSDEANGVGSGHTTPDVVFGDGGVCLRAERRGPGTHRTYLVTVEARDASGNASEAVVEVTVPHDAGYDPMSCPAVPPDAFVDDGDARCDFSSAITAPPSGPAPVAALSPAAASVPGGADGAARATTAVRGGGCSSGPVGSGAGSLVVLVSLFLRRLTSLRRSRRSHEVNP